MRNIDITELDANLANDIAGQNGFQAFECADPAASGAHGNADVLRICLEPRGCRVLRSRTAALSSSRRNNGRKVRQALVELSTQAGQWLGSFLVFGFTTEQLKESAYMQADSNATHKGYTLQSLRESA